MLTIIYKTGKIEYVDKREFIETIRVRNDDNITLRYLVKSDSMTAIEKKEFEVLSSYVKEYSRIQTSPTPDIPFYMLKVEADYKSIDEMFAAIGGSEEPKPVKWHLGQNEKVHNQLIKFITKRVRLRLDAEKVVVAFFQTEYDNQPVFRWEVRASGKGRITKHISHDYPKAVLDLINYPGTFVAAKLLFAFGIFVPEDDLSDWKSVENTIHISGKEVSR